MSLLIQAQTSDDDDEIMECLNLVLRSSKLGLVHESIDVNVAVAYTRKPSCRGTSSHLSTPSIPFGVFSSSPSLWGPRRTRNC